MSFLLGLLFGALIVWVIYDERESRRLERNVDEALARLERTDDDECGPELHGDN